MNEAPLSPKAWFPAVLQDPTDRTANILCLVFILGVVGLILLTGPVPQLLFASDVLNLLDGAHRQYLGQVIHRDFHSPVGGMAFLPFSLSMHLVGPTARALPWGIALTFLVTSGWAWGLTHQRLPFPERMLFLLFVGLLVAGSYPLDFGSWKVPSYAMHYNRIGWAYFSLVALECFVPPRHPTHTGEWIAGVSTGAAVALLFLLKVNFFICAAGLMVWAPFAGRRHHVGRRLAGLTGAAGATLAAVLLARIDLAGYIREIVGMAGSQPAGIYRETLARILSDNRWWLVAVVATTLGLLFFSRPLAPAPRQQVFRSTLAFLLVAGAGLVLSLTNCQFAELPTFPVALLVLSLLLPVAPGSRPALALRTISFLAVLGSILPNAGMIARAYLRHALDAATELNSLKLAPPALAALPLRTWPDEHGGPQAESRIRPKGDGSPYAYGLWLQDGIDLLAPHITPSSRVLSLDWSNPFPFTLGLPPLRNDLIAWHYGRGISDVHHPDQVLLAGQADFILEPRAGIQPASTAFKRELFAPLMAQSFVRLADNRSWILWQRRPAPDSSH